MKSEIDLMIAKHESGNKLGTEEIRALMLYALELLRDIESKTKASIDRAHNLIGQQSELAA